MQRTWDLTSTLLHNHCMQLDNPAVFPQRYGGSFPPNFAATVSVRCLPGRRGYRSLACWWLPPQLTACAPRAVQLKMGNTLPLKQLDRIL